MKDHEQFLISNTKTGKVGRHHLMFRDVTGIERQRDGKWLIKNHSLEHAIDLEKVANIALLDLSPEVNLPVQFLHELNQQHIALVLSDLSSEKIQVLEPHHNHGVDHVTGLHEIRRSEKKSAHVARELILAQAHNRHQQIEPELLKKLKGAQSLSVIRAVEAQLANQYWKTFFRKLYRPDETRHGTGGLQEALNATSHQLAQVVSRHLINHRVPLEHGVMHTSSCALVYDLMAPFRGFAEQAVVDALMIDYVFENDSIDLETFNKIFIKDACEAFTYYLESYHTYRQGTEKKSLQQLIELTVMNLVRYSESQLNTDNSDRFWVPKLGKRRFAREDTHV